MAAKIRCPGCGAKNEATTHRCRICTAVINPAAAKPPAEEPVAPVGIDHFDPNEIDRQVRPPRERFESGGGALAARLAAAGGGAAEPRPAQPTDFSEDALAGPADLAAPDFADRWPQPPVSEAAPIEHEEEPFDPDALFRDMQ